MNTPKHTNPDIVELIALSAGLLVMAEALTREPYFICKPSVGLVFKHHEIISRLNLLPEEQLNVIITRCRHCEVRKMEHNVQRLEDIKPHGDRD